MFSAWWKGLVRLGELSVLPVYEEAGTNGRLTGPSTDTLRKDRLAVRRQG